jgi:DNA polymerase
MSFTSFSAAPQGKLQAVSNAKEIVKISKKLRKVVIYIMQFPFPVVSLEQKSKIIQIFHNTKSLVMKKDIFDEIVDNLRKSAQNNKTSFIHPETAKEFFTDISQPAVSAPAQNTASMSHSQQCPEPQAQNNSFNQQHPRTPQQQHLQQPFPEPQAQHSRQQQTPQAKSLYNESVLAEMSFEGLANTAMGCHQCPLAAGRTNVVFGEGSPQADLMFVGEGPGYDEDMQGRPFVGKAGQLLTKMVNAMQFTREEIYIANIVKCRPPKNRNPLPEEAAACMPYLKRQIELIKPRVIVVLGAVPLKFLLGKTGIMRQRGHWDTYNGIKVMPTFHPAYLLRNPAAKRDTWNDLQQVMQIFGKYHKK